MCVCVCVSIYLTCVCVFVCVHLTCVPGNTPSGQELVDVTWHMRTSNQFKSESTYICILHNNVLLILSLYICPPGLKQIRAPCRVPAAPMSTGAAGGGGGGGGENMMYFLLVGAAVVGGGTYVSSETSWASICRQKGSSPVDLKHLGPHVQSLLTHKKAAYATSHANVRMYKDWLDVKKCGSPRKLNAWLTHISAAFCQLAAHRGNAAQLH